MIAALSAIHAVLSRVNTLLLAVGRSVSWVMMVVMVAVILLQVFYRYILNNAQPWPEEAALSLMIWMMALMAPSAYRWGGFVSIDLLSEHLPKWPRFILTFSLLFLASLVTWFLLNEAWIHYTSPILFNSSGLNRLVQDSGLNQALGTSFEFRSSYIYFGMVACFSMMLLVNIELLIRKIGHFAGHPEAFPVPPAPPFLSTGTE